ncbi:putative sodium/metabolite cotransporter BASS4, chloroplastic, partial [Mucuna pruriens]
MGQPMLESWEGEDGRGSGVGSVEDRGHESSESLHIGTLKVEIVQLENEQKRKVGKCDLKHLNRLSMDLDSPWAGKYMCPFPQCEQISLPRLPLPFRNISLVPRLLLPLPREATIAGFSIAIPSPFVMTLNIISEDISSIRPEGIAVRVPEKEILDPCEKELAMAEMSQRTEPWACSGEWRSDSGRQQWTVATTAADDDSQSLDTETKLFGDKWRQVAEDGSGWRRSMADGGNRRWRPTTDGGGWRRMTADAWDTGTAKLCSDTKLLHLSLLVFNIIAVRSLSVISGGRESLFSREENASALVLVASQKTLPVMVAVIEPLQGAFGESGLLVLPCVAAHLNQIIVDSFIVNFLRPRDNSGNVKVA